MPPYVVLAQPYRWIEESGSVRLEVGDTIAARRRRAILTGACIGFLTLGGLIYIWQNATLPWWAIFLIAVFGWLFAGCAYYAAWQMYPFREAGKAIIEWDRVNHSVVLMTGARLLAAHIVGVRVVEPLFAKYDREVVASHVHVCIERSGERTWMYAWLNASTTWRLAHTLAVKMRVPFEHYRFYLPKDPGARQLLCATNQQFTGTIGRQEPFKGETAA